MGTGASVEDRQPKVEDEPPLQPNPARYLGSAEGPLDRSSSRVRHVRVERTFLGLQTFYHHGVDLGDGRVAHYSKDPTTEPARVRITTVEEFAALSPVEEVCHACSIDPHKVRERIESLQGRQGYSLVFCNCEHFASFCVCGSFQSAQVEEVMESIEAIQRGVSAASTDVLFSGPRESDAAPYMHKKPHWTKMIAVAAMDLVADGLQATVEAVQNYTVRTAAVFDEAVASSSSDLASCSACQNCSDSLGLASSRICPCCEGSDVSFADQPPGGSRPSHMNTGRLFAAVCAGADALTWLASDNPPSHSCSARSEKYLMHEDDAIVQ